MKQLKQLHNEDLNLWLEQIATKIKNKDFSNMDWDGLLEEIEDMTASQKRALRSYTKRLIEHILKLKFWRLRSSTRRVSTPRYAERYPYAKRYPLGLGRLKTQTPVPSSRGTLSAFAHGGNPQDRNASPTDWLGNARDDREKEYNQKGWRREVVATSAFPCV